MTHDLAVDLVQDAGLGVRAEAVVSRIRTSVRISTQRLTSEPKHDGSKFGGRPLLPNGFDWPHWDISASCESQLRHFRRLAERSDAKTWEGQIARIEQELKQPRRPLNFLAQINLAELSEVEGGLGLPKSGRLLFFYDVKQNTGGCDPADRGAWRIIFVDADASLIRLQEPLTIRPDEIYFPCVLSFDVEQTLPIDLRPYGVDLTIEPKKGPYRALLESLANGVQPVHRLAGYPTLIQGPMELQCQLASNGVDCGDADGSNDPRADQLAAGTSDWRLLLQLDSDDKPGWMWGDTGCLYFWIRVDDLHARRFEQVWCIQESC
jgi:uncharacterized protein YwqG